MAKRHRIRAGDWESVFGRLQELVMANSGEDPFEEIFKILIAKLYAELRMPDGDTTSGEDTPIAIEDSINQLLASAARQWPGIVEGLPQSKLAPEHLKVCVGEISDLSLLDTALEVLDNAFEFLVSRVAKGSKGQYFTPRHVIDCCVRIVDPKPHEFIIDPACGSGGFLVHALNHVRSRHPALDTAKYCGERIWGCDFDRRAVQVAKTLMLIAGDGQSNLFRLNSLMTPAANSSLLGLPMEDGVPHLTIEDVVRTRSVKEFKGFDVILTNPPFAGEIKESQILDCYDLSRRNRRVERDVLFLERCIRLLRPGGRIAIVLPHNKLGGAGFEYVRTWVLRHLRVVAVLGLGRNTFLPHTHQKTSILFGVKRDRPLRVVHVENEDILFLLSEKEGKDSRGQIVSREGADPESPAWQRADHDLEEITSRFESFIESNDVCWS